MVGTWQIHSATFTGITRTVAERARVPIIGLKYGHARCVKTSAACGCVSP